MLHRYMNKQFHLVISGAVQGVGYRSWFKKEANHLGITGWVKNREDGAVEAVVQGDEKSLDRLIQKAKSGPDVGLVEYVTVVSQPPDMYLTEFQVIY